VKETVIFSKNGMEEIGYLHSKNEVVFLPNILGKINEKYIHNLNIRVVTLNLLEENTEQKSSWP
jgi:hypothetical protein